MRVLRSDNFLLILLTVIAIDLPRSCRAAVQTEAVSANELSPNMSSGIADALASIFDDEHIPESALTIHRHAAVLHPADRYEYLRRCVLPDHSASPLRLHIDFSPTHPAPPLDASEPQTGHRLYSGGRLISPVMDLVDAAVAVGRLEELRTQVEQIESKDPLTAKNRLSMLALILIEQQHFDEAHRVIDQFAQLSVLEQPDDSLHRAAEAVLFYRTHTLPEARDVLLPTIDRVVTRHKLKYTRSIWNRQFRSLLALREVQDTAPRWSSRQWASASTVSAETRGSGIPAAKWRMMKGQTDNYSSHGDDHLYFAIPMRGNFQIECDVTPFNWSETRLLTCGVWVSPIYDHVRYEAGDIGNLLVRGQISPRLSKIADRIHYRTVVHNLVASTFANGRLIHSHTLPDDHDPWVAIRNGYMQEGTAWNVRVTGTPEVPESILLTTSSGLQGWLPYFGGGAGQPGSHWQVIRRSADSGGGIHGPRLALETGQSDQRPVVTELGKPERPASAHHEQAIFYHRPMLEDGAIEYEFFYRDREICTHPVIDRLCLLMEPDGIKIHWLTDGMFERSALSPENKTIEPSNRRTPNALPLNDNAWNRVRLSLVGDAISVSLNERLVYQRILEATNQRLFGFFHFADREELQVRDVRWTGSWPKSLPEIHEQELAQDEAEFLDETTDHLVNTFQHDFVKEGLAEDRFTIINGNLGKDIQATPDGVLAVRDGTGGYRNATVAPSLEVRGDFDIVVTYDRFESNPSAKGSSSLMLNVFLENSTADEFVLTRRHMFPSVGSEQQIVQCVKVQQSPGGTKRDYFMTKTQEERGGRLRLARRGSRVYYMTAEGDSPNFRLLGARDSSTDPIQMEGIRLITQIHESGQTSVVWKNILIRAESLSGRAVGDADIRLVTLNEERDRLAKSVVFDFTRDSPDTPALYRWADLRPWSVEHKGLRILAQGFDTWQSAGVTTTQAVIGDFDVSGEFEALRLDTPRTGDGTGVFLQVDYPDQTQVSAIFSVNPSGQQEFAAQLRTLKPAGGFDYRTLNSVSAQSASLLRIARRGNLVKILGRSTNTRDDRIIAEVELPDAKPVQAKILLHTGGPDRQSEILVKRLTIRAE